MEKSSLLNPFVKTREMNNVVAVATQFNVRPCDVIGLTTDIGRYCFDVACVAYIRYLEDKQAPRYEGDERVNPGLQTLLG